MGCSVSSAEGMPSGLPVKYVLGRSLGAGKFGRVHTVIAAFGAQEDTGYAVKVVDLWAADGKTSHRAAERETDMWRCVGHHPNIVHFYQAFTDDKSYFMLMEACSFSIMDLLLSNSAPSAQAAHLFMEAGLARSFREMLRALAHVHAAKVVHRDVNLDNLVIGGVDNLTVKLCDFGSAAMLPSNRLLTSCSGAAAYMSPEMISGFGYDTKTDVWSLGVAMYMIIFRSMPYAPCKLCPGSGETMQEVINQGFPIPSFELLPGSTAAGVAPLCRSLLECADKKRPSAKMSLQFDVLKDAPDNTHFDDGTTDSDKASVKTAEMEDTEEGSDDLSAGAVVLAIAEAADWLAETTTRAAEAGAGAVVAFACGAAGAGGVVTLHAAKAAGEAAGAISGAVASSVVPDTVKAEVGKASPGPDPGAALSTLPGGLISL